MADPAVDCCTVESRGQRFILHPERAVFWVEKQWLLLADMHLGKAQHFRRNGIPVANGVFKSNLQRCTSLIRLFEPERVVILGDLFHSTYNRAWDIFAEFVWQHADRAFHLIPGNHDILLPDHYRLARIIVDPVVVVAGPCILSHQRIDDLPEDKLNISGHVHPGVKLRGKGHQAVTVPCFLFRDNEALLPAFGGFTGLSRVAVGPGDQVFAIAAGQVINVSPGQSVTSLE